MMHKALSAGWLLLCCCAGVPANDWPFWRGPEQTGMTREKAIVTEWSQDGDNLLWKVPIGGRTTPILMDGRLYAIVAAGSGDCLQERVVCLDAETGKTIWEHRFNVFHTDIVEARLGFTSVVGDPGTGNVYAHGTGGEFFCFNRDGKVLWKHSLGEVFGRYSGYGGRLHTPIIDEDRVIISYQYILTYYATGKQKAAHRYIAFNKHTGEVEWTSIPGGRPHDTTYSVPVVNVIDGKRMLIGGNADGAIYGMLARTGDRIWSYPMSKRGINTSAVVDGNLVYATHSEENLDGTVMGRVACIDASRTGDLRGKSEVWRRDGIGVGYSSPAVANGRLYVATNDADLYCLNARTGETHWQYDLGRAMKGSPVVTADGVIYVGEVNGRFLILRDEGDKCVLLDEEEFETTGPYMVEILGSPIVADGRVYFMTTEHFYALGKKGTKHPPVKIPPMPDEAEPDIGKMAHALVVPAEVVLSPGQSVQFKARIYDLNGRFLAEAPAAWSTIGFPGRFGRKGQFTAATDNRFAAGLIRADVDIFEAYARARLVPNLPISEDFDAMEPGEPPPGWIGMDLKTELVKQDDNVVLRKNAESPSAPYCRMRAFSGPPIPAGYTVQADLMAEPKAGRSGTLSDMGLINSRYKMILLGYEKQLRLVTWAPIPRLQKEVDFDWQPKTWYRAKLRVDVEDGKGKIRAKVWPRDKDEPDKWNIEMTDPCPNSEGSPGLYAYTKGTTPSKKGSLVYFDNYRVTRDE